MVVQATTSLVDVRHATLFSIHSLSVAGTVPFDHTSFEPESLSQRRKPRDEF
jgi:hypothetical protein